MFIVEPVNLQWQGITTTIFFPDPIFIVWWVFVGKNNISMIKIKDYLPGYLKKKSYHLTIEYSDGGGCRRGVDAISDGTE